MELPRYTSRLGFWIATTLVIIITVFLIILRGAGPGNGGGLAATLWITAGLALIPGSCVGLLQAFLITESSAKQRMKWLGIKVVSTVIGWCVVFAIGGALDRLQSLPPIRDQLAPATYYGFLIGALIGAIVGLVSGVIQESVLPSLRRQWLIGNLISWSIGVAIPVAVFFAAISQIRISF